MTHLGLPVDLVAAQAPQVNLAPAIVARAYSGVYPRKVL